MTDALRCLPLVKLTRYVHFVVQVRHADTCQERSHVHATHVGYRV